MNAVNPDFNLMNQFEKLPALPYLPLFNSYILN